MQNVINYLYREYRYLLCIIPTNEELFELDDKSQFQKLINKRNEFNKAISHLQSLGTQPTITQQAIPAEALREIAERWLKYANDKSKRHNMARETMARCAQEVLQLLVSP